MSRTNRRPPAARPYPARRPARPEEPRPEPARPQEDRPGGESGAEADRPETGTEAGPQARHAEPGGQLEAGVRNRHQADPAAELPDLPRGPDDQGRARHAD